MGGHFALIDPDTPQSAYKFKSNKDGSQWELVFSDEFNVPNRTFYPVSSRIFWGTQCLKPSHASKGDDPYWEAVDLHYWYEIVIFEYSISLSDVL